MSKESDFGKQQAWKTILEWEQTAKNGGEGFFPKEFAEGMLKIMKTVDREGNPTPVINQLSKLAKETWKEGVELTHMMLQVSICGQVRM